MGMRLVVLALLLAYASAQSLSDGLLKDREGLVSLRNAITNQGLSKVKSWKSTGNPCSPVVWKHVTCSAGRVIEINLENLQVVGTLPPKLRSMQALVTLNLAGNKFAGNIPSAWADRTSFQSLQTFNLANNELSGMLPNWNRLGAWRSLKNLDLSTNLFYGGLPTNWLGQQKGIRTVEVIKLANNFLGRSNASFAGRLLPKSGPTGWCKSEADAGLAAGSGWCPTGVPISGTTPNLISLDLSGNSLEGQLPSQWPRMFTRLQKLYLQFNNLNTLDAVGNFLPTSLPSAWTADRKKGFMALSVLMLYPGNEYLCSMQGLDGSYKDPNLDATYQVVDDNLDAYNDDNPWLCPTEFYDDNPIDSLPTMSKTAPTWTYTKPANAYIWGFRVTIWGFDNDGEQWSALTGWTGALVRTYILGGDGFTATQRAWQGISCAGAGGEAGACTLNFAAIDTDSQDRLAPPDFSGLSKLRLEVAVVNLDGVESTSKTSPAISV